MLFQKKTPHLYPEIASLIADKKYIKARKLILLELKQKPDDAYLLKNTRGFYLLLKLSIAIRIYK